MAASDLTMSGKLVVLVELEGRFKKTMVYWIAVKLHTECHYIQTILLNFLKLLVRTHLCPLFTTSALMLNSRQTDKIHTVYWSFFTFPSSPENYRALPNSTANLETWLSSIVVKQYTLVTTLPPACDWTFKDQEHGDNSLCFPFCQHIPCQHMCV